VDALVTVSVLSYRRREALDRVLRSVLAQDYPNLELIVVDNGSGKETTDYLRRRYPGVRLIERAENAGTGARNEGIRAARGDFIVTLDNDVYFDDPQGVRRILEAFRRRPEAGCIVFRVYHPATGRISLRDWCHPRPWQEFEDREFETHYITEGAAAFRREVFQAVEPYWPLLFIGHEGSDLAMRLMDAGYRIWYAPEVKVWHMTSLETRQDWRPFYYYARNLFPVVYRNQPWPEGALYLLSRWGVFGLYALRARAFRRFVRGTLDGLRLLADCRALRRPVKRATLRRIAQLKRGRPGLWSRLVSGKDRLMPLRPAAANSTAVEAAAAGTPGGEEAL
jgi:GT2 family glycosyltransferase